MPQQRLTPAGHVARRRALGRSLACLALASGLLGAPAAAAAQPSCSQPSGQQVIVYHAGSLTAALPRDQIPGTST